MIKCSNIKKICKQKDLTVGLDAYSRLNEILLEILDKGVSQAKSSRAKKLRDYHFDNVEIEWKKRVYRKKEESVK